MRRVRRTECTSTPKSVTVRLAVAAVVAGDRRLDQALAARVRQRIPPVAHVGSEVGDHLTIGPATVTLTGKPARDRLPDHLPQGILVHASSLNSTESTIPITAASTAAAFLPSAAPAALPSITTSTRSPTPAPTESMAMSVAPRGSPAGVSGCTSSSFAPASLWFLCDDTTVPTTVQSCISRGSTGFYGFYGF